jgi:hypothetical protein
MLESIHTFIKKIEEREFLGSNKSNKNLENVRNDLLRKAQERGQQRDERMRRHKKKLMRNGNIEK